MKRLLAASLLIAVATLGAQEKKVRTRWGSRPVETAPAAPKITITSPTQGQTLTVASASLILSGIAESSGLSPLATVTWSNDRGGSGSASATGPGFTAWETVGGAGAETVVLDDFTGSTNIALSSLDASPTGGAWSALHTSGVFYMERRSAGYVQINSTLANAPLSVKATPSPAITGSNYDVSVTTTAVSTSAATPGAILFGIQDTDNYCAAVFYAAGITTDLYLIKRVAGVVSTLGTPVDVNPAANDVFAVEVRGTGLTVTQNGVSRIATTDTFCDDASGVGFGVGAFRLASDDGSTTWRFDNFTVVDQDASAGAITLQSGVNVLTVTVTDAANNTSTDTLTVTLAAPDAIAPEVTITLPTTEPTQSTGTAAIVIEGTCTDNTACTTVSLACPQCTPTSASCTLSGSGTTQTFTCASVAQAAGANALTVTARDALVNSDTDLLTSTLSTSDVTAPVITITSNGGSGVGANFTTTTSPVTISGTASDAVGVTLVRWTNTAGSPGTASGTTAWSGSVPLTSGANALTFIAEDANGNQGTDTITVTYTPTLTITTLTLPPATQNSAYSQTLARTGGTAPFTWDNNSGGSSLGAAACTGLSISVAGVVSGTPTTTGTCNFTAKITDTAAATDTQALSIVVAAAGAAGPHDFFTALIARGDCYRAASLRPVAGNTTGMSIDPTVRGVADCAHPYFTNQLLGSASNGYRASNSAGTSPLTYCYTGAEPNCGGVADTNAEKQDGTKVAVTAFNLITQVVGAAGIDNVSATITVTPCFSAEFNRGLKIDSEIMVVSASGLGCVTSIPVTRGAFGTTKAVHSAGAAIRASSNQVQGADQVQVPLHTDGSVSASYLVTWDAFYTDTYHLTGLTNNKAFQITGFANTKTFIEPQTRFSGQFGTGFVAATDLAAVTMRSYTQPAPPSSSQDPMLPFDGAVFIMKPSTWTRFWILIEANAETDTANFESVTTLAGAITDSTTQLTVRHPSATFSNNPFSVATVMAGTGFPGRRIRIDSEIMTITSCSVCQSAETRTLTVVRGVDGTTPAAHADNATVDIISDYVSMWVADENQNPVQTYDRNRLVIALNHATASFSGGLGKWWVEFGSSTNFALQGRADKGFVDMVAYLRNFVVLKDPPADLSAAGLLAKPVR